MDIVVCKCSKSFLKKNKDLFGYQDSPLTNGKQYELLSIEYYSPYLKQTQVVFYVIKDNNGKITDYESKMFIKLSEYRDKKLDSLLDKILES
jgi:hypothetical protein